MKLIIQNVSLSTKFPHYDIINQDFVYCCKKMEGAFLNDIIGIGKWSNPDPWVCGFFRDTSSDMPFDARIDYCPFCGEKIEIEG